MEISPHPDEAQAIESFATVCERLNDYARSLRSSASFPDVRTGADIRCYAHGWRLEKWVEAELDREEGLWACWWIELGERHGQWLIDSHLSISHHPLFIGLHEDKIVSSDQLHAQLLFAADELVHALKDNAAFSREIDRLKKPREA